MTSTKQREYLAHHYSDYWHQQVERYGLDESCRRYFDLSSKFGPATRILDATIGTGEPIGRHLLDQCIQLYGMDISIGLLRRCRAILPTALLVCADAEAPPFRDGSFDRVVCLRSTWYFEHLGPTLNRLWALTADPGLLVFDYMSRWRSPNLRAWLLFRLKRRVYEGFKNVARHLLGRPLAVTHVHEFVVSDRTVRKCLRRLPGPHRFEIHYRGDTKPMVQVVRGSG